MDIEDPQHPAAPAATGPKPGPTADAAPAAPTSESIHSDHSENDSENTFPSDFSIPDDAADLDREPTFAKSDYPESITGSALDKIHESQVAPLVAVARGYQTIRPSDRDAFVTRVTADGCDKKTAATRRRQVTTALDLGDAMAMPWYAADDVVAAASARTAETIVQLRPARPVSTGKVDKYGNAESKKYDLLAGSMTPVDMHPSQPPEWSSDTTVQVLFTEGIIKADSAMTAMLLDAGIDPEDLMAPRGEGDTAELRAADTRRRAHAELRKMLRALPRAQRTLFLAAVGVGNWRGGSWSSIVLKDGRDVRIAFDGDMARNADVWKQTNRLWKHFESKGAQPSIVDLTMAAADDPSMKKLGLDDYFGIPRLSHWKDIISGQLTEMPARPEVAGRKDEWRIEPEQGLITERYVVPEGDDGEPYWTPVLSFGARVVSVTTLTGVSEDEVADGELDHRDAEDPNTVRVEIEFRWRDGDQIEQATVVGNSAILEQTPTNWEKGASARIPSKLRRLPEWPPRYQQGDKFMQALKANRFEETISSTMWDTMGWVPAAGDDSPAFVIGGEAFTVDGTDASSVRPGVTNHVLPGADRFGLPDLDVSPGEEGFAQYAHDLLKKVSDVFLGRMEGVAPAAQAFQRPEYGAVVFLTGLRPLLPIAPRFTVYLYGPPSKGKSYVAGCAMSFYQHRPGGFKEGSLPGTAEDSTAATEHALSRVPIWVMDDVSPKQDRRAADHQVTVIEGMMRAVFNGATRARMQIRDGEMSQRARAVPRATFMITGEMEPSTASIRQRSILLNMDGSALGSQELNALAPLDEMRNVTNEMALLARVGLEAMLAQVRRVGWEEFYSRVAVTMSDLEMDLTVDKSTPRRAVRIVSDLVAATAVIQAISEEFFDGVDESFEDHADLLCRQLQDLASRVVTVAHEEHRTSTPGVMLMRAVIQSLRTGDAYIASGSGTESPPMSGGSDGSANSAAMTNSMLGWAGGAPRSHGRQIGWLHGEDADGEPLVLLEVSTAFDVAMNRNSRLAGGHGSSPASVWQSAWDSGVPSDRWSRAKRKGGGTHHYAQVRLPNNARPSVVPVRLSKLIEQEPLVADMGSVLDED